MSGEVATAAVVLSRPDFERCKHGCLECGGHRLMPDVRAHGRHQQRFLLCFDCNTEFTTGS